CARLFITSFLIVSPVAASMTFQCGPSNDGVYRTFESGEIDGRSQPPSGALSQRILSVVRSRQSRRRTVLTYSRPVAALAHTPLTFSGSCPSGTAHVGMRRTNL